MERPRLLSLLGTGSDRPALTVVHGYAGSGKTTLLTQWCTAFSEPNEVLVWVTLRPDDASAVPFWQRIGDALERAGILNRPAAESLCRPGPAGDAARRAVLGELGKSHPLTLVLDDYHLVEDDIIDASLQHLVTSVGTLRLIISTRTTGGWHSMSVAARVETIVIDAADLAFTVDESAELVATNSMSDTIGLARVIHDATMGWPLASQALLAEVRRDPESRTLLARAAGTHPQFVAEFVRSALDSRPQTAREFLLRVCLADEVTVDLAALLTGQPAHDTREQLDQLEADGLGTWQVRSGVAWFLLHPLLREAFEAHAVGELDRAIVTRLRGLLSDRLLYERPLRALELAVEIMDWDRVEHISLLRYGPLTHYHRQESTRLLQLVPRAALRERPALMATLHGTIYGLSSTTLDELNHSIETVADAARRHPPRRESVLGALQATAIMAAHRIMGKSKDALAHAERALDLFASSGTEDRSVNARALPTLFAQVATTFLVEGHYARALDILAQSREMPAEAMSTGERFQSTALTALTHAIRGDIVSAEEWIAVCRRVGAYDGWFVGYLDSGYHMARAICALNRWDADDALHAIATPGAREHVIEYWPILALIEARTRLWTSGPLDAHAELTSTLSRKQRRPQPPVPLQAMLSALSVELLLLAGQPVRAEAMTEGSATGNVPVMQLARARLVARRGELDLALSLADSVAWRSEDSPSLRAEALLMVADVCLEFDSLDRAADTFVTAISTIERYNLRLPLLTIPSERLQDLWALASDRGHALDADLINDIPAVLRRTQQVEALSAAERRVLRELLSKTVAGAAEALHLSVHTVRYHLKRSYRKLGVSSRESAVRLAQELGMLDD